MNIPVVTVGDSREDLVGRLERLHGPVSVVRRCSELAELLAACQGGLARAAVVAQGSEELTASLVDRLSDDPLVTREQVLGQMAGRELKSGTVLTAVRKHLRCLSALFTSP